MLESRATTQNSSPTNLELDAAMRSGRLRRDGDPALGWCVGNVVGRPDRRGNLYRAKQRPKQKIDAAVALLMAVGRAMAEDASEGDLEDLLRNPVIARPAGGPPRRPTPSGSAAPRTAPAGLRSRRARPWAGSLARPAQGPERDERAHLMRL